MIIPLVTVRTGKETAETRTGQDQGGQHRHRSGHIAVAPHERGRAGDPQHRSDVHRGLLEPAATPADSTAACRTTPCVAAVITVPKALAARDQDLGPRAKAR